MDLTELTPAPWEVKLDRGSGIFYVPLPGGYPMLLAEDDDDHRRRAALELAALARNALDVMVRRGWSVGSDDFGKTFCLGVGCGCDLWMWAKAQRFTDPFTALVEADRWYRENVEANRP